MGKGNRRRCVPLNARARQCVLDLVDFNRRRGFSVVGESPLLQTRCHKRLPTRALRALVQRYRERADLDVRYSPLGQAQRHIKRKSLSLEELTDIREGPGAMPDRQNLQAARLDQVKKTITTDNAFPQIHAGVFWNHPARLRKFERSLDLLIDLPANLSGKVCTLTLCQILVDTGQVVCCLSKPEQL